MAEPLDIDGGDGDASSCGNCDGKCGTVVEDGCPAYECDPCGDAGQCVPRVTCESIDAQCGTVDNGCGEREACVDQCEGLPCVDYRCCEPEDVATTCRGLCGGMATNNCGQEIACENPCGPSSSGCEESSEGQAALCLCPHADQGETCEQTQFLMDQPRDIAFDVRTGFGYVLDEGRDAVLRVDHRTGQRIVLSDDDDDGVPHGAGPGFLTPNSLLLDPENERLFVSDWDRHAIFEVNLHTGNRKVVSDENDEGARRGEGEPLSFPSGMALDATGARLFVASHPGELFSIRLTPGLHYGDRDVVSTAGIAGVLLEVGTGPKLDGPYEIALDLPNDKAYVFTTGAVISVELATGNRALVSRGFSPNDTVPLRGTGPQILWGGNGIIQTSSGRAIVADSLRNAIVAVDLTSGDRTIISGKDENEQILGTGPMFNEDLETLDFDADDRYVLSPSKGDRAVYRIDTATGDRSVVYDSEVGTGPSFDAPRNLDLRLAEGIAYVADRKKGIFRVDLTTGERTIVAPFESLGDAVVHPDGESAYVIEQESLVRVSLATNERTRIGDDRGFGESYMVYDAALTRLLISENYMSILSEIDLPSGRRSVLSGHDVRGSGPVISAPSGLVLDSPRNRAFVSDARCQGIVSINLQTGDRTLVSGSAYEESSGERSTVLGAGPLPNAVVAIDADANSLYVCAGTAGADAGLYRVDLATGDRTAVSIFSTVPGGSMGSEPSLCDGSSVLEKESGFLYSVGSGLGRTDLATGNRRLISHSSFP